VFHHLDSALSAEIRRTIDHLKPYPGDPTGLAKNYTSADIAYAVNVTLLSGGLYWHPAGMWLPTAHTEAMLVRRADGDRAGDGIPRSLSGVSGYIDRPHDDVLTDEAYDLVAYAARRELSGECNIPEDRVRTIGLSIGSVLGFSGVDLALGQRFEEPRFGGHGILNVVPIIGMCYDSKPPTHPNPEELSEIIWAPLGEIAQLPDLSPGYLESTLPNALGSTGLRPEAIHMLLYP
jgi:hypothetical protein